jgi:hypothetical protein
MIDHTKWKGCLSDTTSNVSSDVDDNAAANDNDATNNTLDPTSNCGTPSLNFEQDQPGKTPKRKKVASAIRKGLELMKESVGGKQGLFHFFGKGTISDRNQYFSREDEKHKEHMEEEKYTSERMQKIQLDNRRERARLRKQKSRATKQALEFANSTKKLGEKKKRVRLLSSDIRATTYQR